MRELRILIVEDENIVAEYLRDLLSKLGYSIAGTTAYGETAVTLAAEVVPDLVLMDIKLRGRMTGFEAAEAITSTLNVPVIYLTAYVDDDTIEKAKATGPYGYILKPFKEGDLRSAIEVAAHRHALEKLVREKEESYRILSENLPGIVYRLFLQERRSIFFNDMVTPVTGHAGSDIRPCRNRVLGDLVVEEDRDEVEKVIGSAEAAQEPYSIVYRIRCKDGGIRFVSERGRPIGNGGVGSHIDGVIFDITDQMQIQEELRVASATVCERNDFIESVLTSIQSGIIVTDLDLRISLVNPYVEHLSRTPFTTVVGGSLRDFCPEMHQAVMEGISYGEVSPRAWGEGIVVGFTRFDLKQEDSVVGHLITLKDLTEVIRIRAVMQEKERLATMGQVVSVIAHEVRNPLFGMTAAAQLLSLELDLNAEQKVLMDQLMGESRRLNRLVEDLLFTSREPKLAMRPFDLVEVVDGVLSLSSSSLDRKRISVERTIPSSVPVTGDSEKLTQVVLNVVRNAVESTPEGGTISISLSLSDDSVRIGIADSGPGITDSALPRIFDIFFTTKKRGSGLGLFISKAIMDAHGGSLSATNRAAGGAVFFISLPRGTQ